MKNPQEYLDAINIINSWVKSIDAANNLINDGHPDVKKVFNERTSADTYKSMQESTLYLTAKDFLNRVLM